jgi:DNA-binding NtrC family response regulator
MKKGKILCVDDTPDILSSLKRLLKSKGFEVILASSGKDALSILEKEVCDVALIDYMMPEMNGIELISKIKEKNYDVEPLMLTAYGDISLVVKAMKVGAYDYVLKPWNSELLISIINRVLEYKKLLKEKEFLQNQLKEKYRFENLVGSSLSMRKIFEIIEKVNDSDDIVLIQGESGTGKEQVARAIHFSGKRKDRPFVPVDCASLTPNLIESELFGHVKGAFTGADRNKVGLLKSADKGTIFIDEITEIPLNIQAKFLRTLQEMVIKPIGSNKSEKIEARIIAATNRDIYKAVKNGEFREDLFYRLNIVLIKIPPLREHKEDIPILVDHFIKEFSNKEKKLKGITAEALSALMNYNWPGNVRELENCIKRSFTLGYGELVDIKEIPEEIFPKRKEEGAELKNIIAETEREKIIHTIMQFNRNKRKAAEFLGIGKSTLYNKLKKYNIDL